MQALSQWVRWLTVAEILVLRTKFGLRPSQDRIFRHNNVVACGMRVQLKRTELN